jgi:hypothetical protein
VTEAGAGYITDVEYTATSNPHQAPAGLSYIAAINGYAAPRPDEPFAWCELGCGKGLTALLLAAMHPQAPAACQAGLSVSALRRAAQ